MKQLEPYFLLERWHKLAGIEKNVNNPDEMDIESDDRITAFINDFINDPTEDTLEGMYGYAKEQIENVFRYFFAQLKNHPSHIENLLDFMRSKEELKNLAEELQTY